MKKILIIRFSSIGDIIITTPVIRCVALQTSAEIHFLVKPNFASILEHNTYIQKIHRYKDIQTTRKMINEEKFDLIIDLQKNLKSLLATFLHTSPVVTFNKLNIKKWLYVKFKINFLPPIHLVDRYFDALRPYHITNDGKGLDFFFHPNKPSYNLPLDLNERYNVLVMGANYFTKRIPISKCKEIIASSPYPVILLGGSDVRLDAEELWQYFQESTINMVGKITLEESALIIKNAITVFTGDTGLMHIAAALQKNIVVLWGNTTPALGMYPYFGNHGNGSYIAVENLKLSCRPCSKLGYSSCPKSHFKCMHDLDLNFLKMRDVQ